MDKIPSPNECAHLSLTQVDWSFKIIETYKKVHIYYGDYFESVIPNKKGGYNFFEVFVSNYLSILRKYLSGGFVFQREKYRLFRYYLCQWIRLLYITKGNYVFDTNHIWGILFTEYWWCPYFYIGIVAIWLKEKASF